MTCFMTSTSLIGIWLVMSISTITISQANSRNPCRRAKEKAESCITSFKTELRLEARLTKCLSYYMLECCITIEYLAEGCYNQQMIKWKLKGAIKNRKSYRKCRGAGLCLYSISNASFSKDTNNTTFDHKINILRKTSQILNGISISAETDASKNETMVNNSGLQKQQSISFDNTAREPRNVIKTSPYLHRHLLSINEDNSELPNDDNYDQQLFKRYAAHKNHDSFKKNYENEIPSEQDNHDGSIRHNFIASADKNPKRVKLEKESLFEQRFSSNLENNLNFKNVPKENAFIRKKYLNDYDPFEADKTKSPFDEDNSYDYDARNNNIPKLVGSNKLQRLKAKNQKHVKHRQRLIQNESVKFKRNTNSKDNAPQAIPDTQVSIRAKVADIDFLRMQLPHSKKETVMEKLNFHRRPGISKVNPDSESDPENNKQKRMQRAIGARERHVKSASSSFLYSDKNIKPLESNKDSKLMLKEDTKHADNETSKSEKNRNLTAAVNKSQNNDRQPSHQRQMDTGSDCVLDTLKSHTLYCNIVLSQHQNVIETALETQLKTTVACSKLEAVRGCLSSSEYFSKCDGRESADFSNLKNKIEANIAQLHCSGNFLNISNFLVAFMLFVVLLTL